MKNGIYVRIVTVLFIVAIAVSGTDVYRVPVAVAAETGADCTSLCKNALKATGNAENLKYKSQLALDFGALDSSSRKCVSEMIYLCDKKEVYSIAVINTKSTKDAKKLYKSLKAYKKANAKSDYLSDYTDTEQKVFKNALVAKSGTYVWYIAMSDKKRDNTKGSKAIKKYL